MTMTTDEIIDELAALSNRVQQMPFAKGKCALISNIRSNLRFLRMHKGTEYGATFLYERKREYALVFGAMY